MTISPSSVYLSSKIQPRNPKDNLASEEKVLDLEFVSDCTGLLNSLRSNTLLKVNVK